MDATVVYDISTSGTLPNAVANANGAFDKELA